MPDDQRGDLPPVPAAKPQPRHLTAAAPGRAPFVPMLLMALALVAWFGAQLWDGYQQRQQLLAAHGAQQQTVDNASKLRQSLDALAADTQRMADGGNANAALLVTELRKRGITISVPGAGAGAGAGWCGSRTKESRCGAKPFLNRTSPLPPHPRCACAIAG